MELPGQLPHHRPPPHEQQRIRSLRPYVREAQETFRPTWHLKKRNLFDFLLIHLLEGTGHFSVGEKQFNVAPGDLIWIPPDTPHEMRGHAPGTRLQYIHFDLLYDPQRSHWSASIPGGTTDLSAWPGQMHPPIHDPVVGSWCGKIKAFNQTVVTELMRRIVLEYSRTHKTGLTVSGLVTQLIGHLLNAQVKTSLSGRQLRAMENAMQQIQTNKRLNLATLPKQYGISPSHFRKLFREHFGQSPRSACLNANMRAACDYLIYTDLNISEIAEKLGYTNVHNFSRTFRRVLGRPPTAYRAGHPAPSGGTAESTELNREINLS